MDQLTKIETIAAGGALIISAGSFWYLNSKLDEGTTKLDIIQKQFITQIAKMSQHDDDIKIIGGKIKDFEQIVKELEALKTDFGTMAEELSDEFQKVKKDLNKHDRSIQQINDKLDLISKQLGIQHNEVVVKDKNIKSKRKLKPKIEPSINWKRELNKEISKEENTEENVFNEMNAILNS